MKKVLYILLPVLFAVIIFFCFSFVKMDANASNWTESERFGVMLISFLSTFFGLAAANSINNDD